MRKLFFIFCLLLAFHRTQAQEIFMSAIQKEENEEINFDILGKVDSSCVIYKNIRWRHELCWYDGQMNIIKTLRLSFIPERTMNVDAYIKSGYIYLVYQYERNDQVFCYGARVNARNYEEDKPVLLDTTLVSFFADAKIYGTSLSDDKSKLLLYKMHMKNGRLMLLTKLFANGFSLIDSNRILVPFNDRQEYYGDPVVANEGSVFLIKQFRDRGGENFKSLQLLFRQPGNTDYTPVEFLLDGRFIDDARIKIDNANKNVILSSFYYQENRGNVSGLFSAILYADQRIKTAFNVFDDSLRNNQNAQGKFKEAFDNFFIRQQYVRKNGSLIITSENFYSQGRSNQGIWNRNDMLMNYPFYSPNDFFLTSPYYNGFYQPFRPFNTLQSTRYFYEDILVMSLDSSLNLKWSVIIPKRQYEDDNENYLSFGTMNAGGELHFLFVDNNQKNQVVSNQSIGPGGKVFRYPSLKNRNTTFSFMPRLAKQIGPLEMVFPCVRLGSIVFARVVFEN